MKTVFSLIILALFSSGLWAQENPIRVFAKDFGIRGKAKSADIEVYGFTFPGDIKYDSILRQRHRITFREDGSLDSVFSAEGNSPLQLESTCQFVNDTAVLTVYSGKKGTAKAVFNLQRKPVYTQLTFLPGQCSETFFTYDEAGRLIKEAKRKCDRTEQSIVYTYQLIKNGLIKRTQSDAAEGGYTLLNDSMQKKMIVDMPNGREKNVYEFFYDKNQQLIRHTLKYFRLRNSKWVADDIFFEERNKLIYDKEKNVVYKKTTATDRPAVLQKTTYTYWSEKKPMPAPLRAF